MRELKLRTGEGNISRPFVGPGACKTGVKMLSDLSQPGSQGLGWFYGASFLDSGSAKRSTAPWDPLSLECLRFLIDSLVHQGFGTRYPFADIQHPVIVLCCCLLTQYGRA